MFPFFIAKKNVIFTNILKKNYVPLSSLKKKKKNQKNHIPPDFLHPLGINSNHSLALMQKMC